MNDQAAAVAATKTAVESVKMSDGRTVEFVGKRRMVKEPLINAEAREVKVRIDFRNGETRTYDVSGSPHFLQFAAHGAEQKYGDEVAGLKGPNGEDADIDDMVLAIDDLHERLQKGEWTMKREGSGIAGTSVLLRALMELSGKTVEQVKEFLTGKTQAEKLALRNSAKVKPIVERIEQEKISKLAKVDTDALLAGL